MENKKIATATRWEVRSEFQRLMRRFGLKRKGNIFAYYFSRNPFEAEGKEGTKLWKPVELTMTGRDLTLRVFCNDGDEAERVRKELGKQLVTYPHSKLSSDGRGLGYMWVGSVRNVVSLCMVVRPTVDGRIPALRLRVYADLMQSFILRNFSKEVWHKEFAPEEVITY